MGGIHPFDWILLTVFAGYTASFTCLVVERRARGQRPDGRSTCVCGRTIPMYRNIPIVSWLLQRGRAACCGAPIPRWYFFAELGTVATAVTGGLLARWPGGLLGTAAAVAAIAIWHHTVVGRRVERP